MVLLYLEMTNLNDLIFRDEILLIAMQKNMAVAINITAMARTICLACLLPMNMI